jgi:ATP-dependent Clp protease ATP-binding subunit ClpA
MQSPMGFRSTKIGVDEVQGDINRELERRFSPEFRNRIDQVVVFEPLARDEVRLIALKYIGEVTATLQRRNKSLVVDPEALEQLVVEGHSLAYGARFLKRVIDDRIKLPLSRQWKDADAFRVTLKDGRITLEAITGPRLVSSPGPDAIAV